MSAEVRDKLEVVTVPTERVFAGHGLRCTTKRRVIFETLRAAKTHPTAEWLFEQARDRTEGISLATVYNALEAFCRAGLARKIAGTVGGSARYDAETEEHLHARCQATGAVVDVPQDLGRQLMDHLPPALLAEIERELGFEISRVQIELVGRFNNEERGVAVGEGFGI